MRPLFSKHASLVGLVGSLALLVPVQSSAQAAAAAKPAERAPAAARPGQAEAKPGPTPPPNPAPKAGEEPLPPSGPPAAVPEAEAPAVAPAPPSAAAAPAAPTATAPTAPADPNAAPPPDAQSIADDVQGLRTDVENFKFQWQRERDIHTAITTRALTIGGTLQTRFGWTDQPTTNGVVYRRKTSFDVPTALLNFNGNLYKDYEDGRNLSYSLSFGVSQQTNTNNSFLNLLNGSITYSFVPTTSPEYEVLTVTAGQQLLPFGLEVPASEELKPVIRNAQFTTKLNLARRDVGAIVRGDLFPSVDYGYNYRQALFAYAIGVLNGSGPNTLDENDNKDIIARIAFTVPSDYNSWLRQITLGGTAYIGKQNLYTPDAAKTLQGKGVKNRFGGDIYYNHWPFGLTYEYIRAEDAQTPGPTPQAPNRKSVWSEAHTATFFLSFGEQFVAGFRNQGRYDDWWPKTYQPFLRFDRFNSDVDLHGDAAQRLDIYTAGLNIFFAETSKFQLNFNHSRNTVKDTRAATPRIAIAKQNSNEVLAQVQFGF
jgi:hypothetical protein